MPTPTLAFDLRDHAALEAELGRASGTLAVEDTIAAWIEDLIHGLADQLRGFEQESWREAIDPYLLVELQRETLGALLALDADDEAAAAAALEVSVEAIRDILHDIGAGLGATEPTAPAAMTRRLKEAMGASTQETAELLGARKRTVERWLAGESQPQGDDAMRLQLAARLVDQLRHAMTGRGVMLWFATGLPEYGGRTPADLLAEPAAAPTLLALAGRARRSDAS